MAPDRPASIDANARRLLELLQERIDDLVARIGARIVPAYEAEALDEPISPDEIAAASEAFTRVAVAAMLENRPPSETELALAAQLGERRARQGVSLETLLHGFRVAAREGLETMQQLALETGLDVPAAMSLAGALWDWIDAISVEVTQAHHGVELALARRDQQQRVAFLHGLVRGTLSAHDVEEQALAFRIDPAADHLVVRVRPTAEHTADQLERLLVPSVFAAGLVALVDEEVVAILPSAPNELPVPAGAGSAGPLGALPRSFHEAGRAREAAEHFGLDGCHSLPELGLRATVLGDPVVGDVLRARYLEPVVALGDFGEELLRSVRAYVAHQQNIDAAAKELFVHPNTLRHRLSRFEETTGASLRNVEQLAEVWWVLTLAPG